MAVVVCVVYDLLLFEYLVNDYENLSLSSSKKFLVFAKMASKKPGGLGALVG
jgi:hypothetical protein